MCELTLELYRFEEELMKKKPKRVSMGIFIDEINPQLTVVTYPDGTQKFVYGAITLEDLRNHDDKIEYSERWYE